MKTQRNKKPTVFDRKPSGSTEKLVFLGVVGGILCGIMAFQAEANSTDYEYFQYAVTQGEGPTSDSDLAGFSVVAFNANYDDPEIRLGADIYDFRIDTSIYPHNRLWVSYVVSENENGEVEKLWSNYTPSLKVGDKLTAEISVENRVGDSVYAPLTLDVLDFDLSGNQNGVTDILCTYEADTDQDGWIDVTGSRLVSDAIANHDGNIARWQQLCRPGFDHRDGDAFATLTFEAVGESVPEPSTLALLAGAGIAGVGVSLVGRNRKRSR